MEFGAGLAGGGGYFVFDAEGLGFRVDGEAAFEVEVVTVEDEVGGFDAGFAVAGLCRVAVVGLGGGGGSVGRLGELESFRGDGAV